MKQHQDYLYCPLAIIPLPNLKVMHPSQGQTVYCSLDMPELEQMSTLPSISQRTLDVQMSIEKEED